MSIRRTLTFAGIVIMTAGLSLPASSQIGLRKGLKGGRSQSDLSGTRYADTKTLTTWGGGVSLEFGILGILSFEVDALLSAKGCTVQSPGGAAREVRINTLALPVLLKKKFLPIGIHPFVLGGMEFASLLSASDGGNSIKDQLFSNQTSAVAGAGVEFSLLGKGVSVEGRYVHGLDDLFKNGASGNAKNRSTQIFAGVTF
jgi:hypothetical protein